MSITCEPFGRTHAGAGVERYSLSNAGGMQAAIMTYGGTLLALRVPDRNGVLGDVVLGFETLAPYFEQHSYFGASIGRYANRIAGGRFELNGHIYTLPRNDGPNHLHGGPHGFHQAVWRASEKISAGGQSLELSYLSRDGEEGYPGDLSVQVTYTLTDDNALRIDYSASTDRDTVLNLTNHSYFNLAGSGDILTHELELFASHFLPVDTTLIPTGELRPVRATPMDFRSTTHVGARIAADDDQIRRAQGYDHTWILDKEVGRLALAARLTEPMTGRIMEVSTTQPGVQFYSGNVLDGSCVGKRGQRYTRRSGLCLETQHFPDSPNQPRFPSTVLRPGDTFNHATLYRFKV